MSERYAWRLLAAYRKEGTAALAHGNRGRRTHNAVSDDEAAVVIQLASTTYAEANHTRLTELLREREGIDLSRPTVRRILTKPGVPSPRKRRPRKHTRVRRQQMPQEGMLVQIDVSHHRWLGDDGPQFTLLLDVARWSLKRQIDDSRPAAGLTRPPIESGTSPPRESRFSRPPRTSLHLGHLALQTADRRELVRVGRLVQGPPSGLDQCQGRRQNVPLGLSTSDMIPD